MATKILLKKSVTGGASPLTADLDQGELAINLVDRKIYTKDSGNNIKEITGAYVDASAPSNPIEGDLWYDTANNLLKAHNGTAFVSAGYATLGALEDVTLTSITSGDHLTWNGSAFVNSNLETDVEGFMSAATTGTGHGDLTYANGVYTFDKVTSAEVRGDISVTDNGGDGSLSYDNGTGVISYTGPSAAEVQAHITGGTGISVTAGEVALDFADAGFKTDNVVEGTTNLYFTDERVDDRVGALVVGGTNITATYDDAAGTLTIDQDASAGLDLSNNDTDDLSEGSTNQYYLDSRARAAISVTDAGGDGSASYDNSTGVITYTGPSAAEVRAHHTGGTGVTITSGSIAIGQPVATTDNVTFNKVTTSLIEGGSTITIDPAGLGDNTGEVIIAGDLTVQGTTTTVNSNEVNIGDAIILLNSDETGSASAPAGFEIERGTDANVSFIWDEAVDKWDLDNEELHNVVIDGGSY
jgi:hypothetical protein